MEKTNKLLIFIISLFIFLYALLLYRDANAVVIIGGGYCSTTPVLKQSVGATGTDLKFIGYDDANDYVEMQGNFTASSSYTVDYVIVYIQSLSGCVRNIWGSFRAAGASPGAVIANGDSSTNNSYGAGPGEVTLTYAEGSKPSLVNATGYWFGVKIDGIDGSDFINVGFDAAQSSTVTRGTAAPAWTVWDSTSEIRVKIYGH